jgi:multidrug transporter EmrE-like cation transporter
MSQPHSLTIAELSGLILTPVIISTGQVMFKIVSERLDAPSLNSLVRLFLDPLMLLALTIYGVGTIVWIYLLRTVPLSTAYPFMGLPFCLVPILSAYWLGEPLSWRTGVATAMIIGGLVVANS